jgi:hypothetical protein
MTADCTIYVYLLDEGVNVWRPVAAQPLGADLYRLEGSVPADESWQFQPGTVVRCQERLLSEGPRLVAVAQVHA